MNLNSSFMNYRIQENNPKIKSLVIQIGFAQLFWLEVDITVHFSSTPHIARRDLKISICFLFAFILDPLRKNQKVHRHQDVRLLT